MHAGFHFGNAAHMLAQIVRQLDAFAPLLIAVHAAAAQFHHDIGRRIAGVVGQVGADAERAADASLTLTEQFQCFREVQRVAEDDGFGRRIDAQLLITVNQLVHKPEFITGVTTHTVKQFGLFAAEVA